MCYVHNKLCLMQNILEQSMPRQTLWNCIRVHCCYTEIKFSCELTLITRLSRGLSMPLCSPRNLPTFAQWDFTFWRRPPLYRCLPGRKSLHHCIPFIPAKLFFFSLCRFEWRIRQQDSQILGMEPRQGTMLPGERQVNRLQDFSLSLHKTSRKVLHDELFWRFLQSCYIPIFSCFNVWKCTSIAVFVRLVL